MDHQFENIGWTVGNYCNARCGHCYSWKVRKDSDEYLSRSDVDRVVQQLVRLGIKTVNLGGNEPIYTHGTNIRATLLPYIVRTLTENNIPVGLTTNGISYKYLVENHLEELMMINDIDFSLDSPFETEHDANRGGKLYQLTIDAMKSAVDLGIDCSVIACGMKENFTEQYLSAYLSLTKLIGSEFRINTLKPVESALLAQMPDSDQFYKGFEFLMAHTSCVTLGESCLTAFTETGTPGCPCGTSSFRINAKTKQGTIPINPCVYMHEFKVGDLLTQDIFDIVSSEQFREFGGRRKHIPQACRDSKCDYLETCRGGCSARAFLVNGTLNSKDPYCPQEYVEKHGKPSLPHRPEIGCHDGIRVHDNYLCTWIGEVNPEFNHHSLHDFEQFRSNPGHVGETRHMSGCRQSTTPGQPSLEEDGLVRLKRKPASVHPTTQ